GAITQNEEPEAPPQQPSRSTSNPGIGGITDGFEAVIPADSIFNVSQTSPQPPQREVEKDQTIDFSEMFGHLGDGSASQVSQPSTPGNEPVNLHESENLNSILNNPNVPFEEKLALFLFDFMEKAEKDLLSKMEQLEKSRTTQKSNTAGNQSADVQGAANGQGTDSEQVAMEKLKLAHDKMTRIFSTVDNLLTSNNKSIKEGPIASLR
ncbi:hypothetical protein L0244_08185, partial [bacterium]|nr:hypothetical protein [bacterium]